MYLYAKLQHIRMDAGEMGMGSREEHRISIPDHNNAGGSGVSAGPGITEEVMNSLPRYHPNADEKWIREMEDKIKSAYADFLRSPLDFKDEPEEKICKLPLRDSISRPTLQKVGEFSRPSVVEIGPFHRRNKVSISDKEKWIIVDLMKLLCGLDLASCLVKIRNQVVDARRCYSNLDITQSFHSDYYKSFAEMLLLDSCFILFTLTVQICITTSGYTLKPITPNPARPGQEVPLYQEKATKFLDIIFNKDEIAPDLLIFDNQIPFFVIKELFNELNLDKPLLEYALEFFEKIHPRSAQHCKDQNISPPEFLHLLELFHWSRVPQNKYFEPIIGPSPQQLDSIARVSYIPNAMELRESATMFEKKAFGSSLDITFQRRRFKGIIGVLDIPELHILDYSSLIFYNLIVFEMLSSTPGHCTMAFSTLMRNLLQSEEDAKLLRQRGILVSSSMTDRQLIDLFARLRRLTENHEIPYDLSDICHQVMSYHNVVTVSRFFRFIILWYFPNPQATFLVFVAALLFVPTLLQTIYAMIYHG